MAIKLEEEYGNAVAGDANYPGGSFKNATTGGSSDGTPLEKKWANDWLGFFQALLTEAGIVPSGAPDTAVASQYFEALQALFAAAVHTHASYLSKTDIVLPTTELRGATEAIVDLTAVNWTSINLSAVVPAGARFVIAHFSIRTNGPNNSNMSYLMCRPVEVLEPGIAVVSVNAGGESGSLGNGSQSIVPIGASRVLQLKFTATQVPAVLNVYYRVQGYIM